VNDLMENPLDYKKRLLQKILENMKEYERICPFFLYCWRFPYGTVSKEPLDNACCWGGTGDREKFRSICIKQASEYFWLEERKSAKGCV
jgi:hypothetical protein